MLVFGFAWIVFLFSVSAGGTEYQVAAPELCGDHCTLPMKCHIRANRTTGWLCAPPELNFEEDAFSDSLEKYVQGRIVDYMGSLNKTLGGSGSGNSNVCGGSADWSSPEIILAAANLVVSILGLTFAGGTFYFFVKPWFIRRRALRQQHSSPRIVQVSSYGSARPSSLLSSATSCDTRF